jgi:hypothetical protein
VDDRGTKSAQPWWAVLTVWGVVNAVNILQAVGFLTRPVAPELNRVLGIVIMALAVPATAALVAFSRTRSGWRFVVGPLVFDAFVAFSLVVDYWMAIEFRQPPEPAILVPYLGLFFGAIFLMGAPMLRLDRRLWAVTAATTIALLVAMVWAIGQGVG